MILSNDNYTVKTTVSDVLFIQTGQLNDFDIVYNLQKYTVQDDFYKTILIEISSPRKCLTIALIGSAQCWNTDHAILKGNVLTLLQDDYIYQINVSDGTVLQCIYLDAYGPTFSIYKITSGYVIHGELEIIGLDNYFQKKWAFSGYDIWDTYTGEKAFELCDGYIKLIDFEGNYYELDIDGNLLTMCHSAESYF